MSKTIEDGGLAFPGTRWEQVGTVSDHGFSDDDSPTFDFVPHSGMSLRGWFAGNALPAACTLAFGNVAQATSMGLLPEEWAAKIACRVADEMIAALSLSNGGEQG